MRNVVHVAQETHKNSRRWMWAIMVAGGIETAALLAGAILLIVALIGDFPDDKSMAVFVLVFGDGTGRVLAWTLKALHRGKRWARGPLVTWPPFQNAVAIPVRHGSTTPIALVSPVH